MGKVNLRNRLRDKNGNDPEPNNNDRNSEDNRQEININSNQTNTTEKEPQKKEDNEPKNNNEKIRNNDIEEKRYIKKHITENISNQSLKKNTSNFGGLENQEDIFNDKKKPKAKFLGNKNNNKSGGFFDKYNINKRMMIIALICAIGASFLVINYLKSFSEERLYSSKLMTVLVARTDINEKTIITDDHLGTIDIPKKYVLSNSIIVDDEFKSSDYVGKVALSNVYKNEQLNPKRLIKKEKSPWLTPSVPANHRAFTISTNALSYIKPADHIDLLVSIKDPQNPSKVIYTPILQNASVLAVDGRYRMELNSNSGTTFAGESITLAVPNKYINVISMLQDRGNFRISLRGLNDKTNLESEYTIEQLVNMFNQPIEKPKPAPTPKTIIKYIKPAPTPRPTPKPVYRKPVYRKPVYRKPVYRPTPKPTPVAVKTPKPKKTVTVINGTSMNTQEIEKESKE